MAESGDHVGESIAERLDQALSEIRALHADPPDHVTIDAILVAHNHAILALADIIATLSAEIDRLRHQSPPSSS